MINGLHWDNALADHPNWMDIEMEFDPEGQTAEVHSLSGACAEEDSHCYLNLAQLTELRDYLNTMIEGGA